MGTVRGSSPANLVINGRQVFEEELGIPFLPDQKTLGAPLRIGIGSNGNLRYTTVEGVEKEVQMLDIAKLDVLFPAQYVMPTAFLSTNVATTGEVGKSINVGLTMTFNQNDAGEIETQSITKNGTVISNNFTHTDNGVVLGITPIVYRGSVDYFPGAVKENPLGNMSPIGRIEDGVVFTNQISFRGYYFIGYGPVADLPVARTGARALPGSRLSGDANTFTFSTGTTLKTQVIVVSPDKSLVSVKDLSALNLDITSDFVLMNSNFSVNDAAGVQVNGYSLYARTQLLAYNLPHTFEVTLKNK